MSELTYTETESNREAELSSKSRSSSEDWSSVEHSTAKSFGIRRTEILSVQYTHWAFTALFFFSIFIVAFTYSLDGTIRFTYQTEATNSFGAHSSLATVNVVKAVVAAAAQPTFARLSDIFGRLELFVVCILWYSMGTVAIWMSHEIILYSVGSAIYQVGYSGAILLLQVIIADYSKLNWRLVASFIPALPFIINTWVSGDVASQSLAHHDWSYCIGIWSFIFPIACLPFLGFLILMQMKARKTREWQDLRIDEKVVLFRWESWKDNILIELFWKIDVVGVLLIICIFGFILVPLTIAGNVDYDAVTSGSKTAWSNASTIAPLVVGFVLIFPFIWWEAKIAKHPVFPMKLMKDRGVWSALMIAILIDFIYYMPNDFMFTVLSVAMNASVKAATRITSLYSFVSVIVGPLVGLVVVRVRRLKGFIIFGVLCWIGALAILYSYRGDNDGVYYTKYINGVIGGLCLMGFGAGFFTYSTQVSISTCTNHEHMAVVISIYLAFYNIGMAIGAAVSGAVWSNTLYDNIVNEFRKSGLDTSLAIPAYNEPLTFIVTYVWGTPERIALVLAYAKTQKILCIIGLLLCFILLFMTFFLRDHRLDNVQSLDNNHKSGLREDDGEIVVNNYDDDVVFKKLKSLFRRRR